MSTITSAHLSIAAGRAPGAVVVTVHGTLDIRAAASLRRVLDGIGEDPEVGAIRVDLHDVRGVDPDGIAGLAEAANQVRLRGAEVTLSDPPELLCEALEAQGLTGLVRMGQHDRQPLLTSAVDRHQARRSHPAGHLIGVDGFDGFDGPQVQT